MSLIPAVNFPKHALDLVELAMGYPEATIAVKV